MVPLAINAFRTEEMEISGQMTEFKFEMNCDSMVETVFDGKFSFDVTFAYIILSFKSLAFG